MRISILLLLVSILLGLPVISYGQGRGYHDAPQCETDIDRNFSVGKAVNDINEVDALLASASGEPLTYPALGTAKTLMQDAWSNLEQVMNLGALKFSRYCVTCNPDQYLNAANALVHISRQVYRNPDYCEFCGLVETMENNLQQLDYCGFLASTSPPPSSLIGNWEFGRVDVTLPLCGAPPQTNRFSLTTNPSPRGRIIDSCHVNESTYWLLGNELIFVHADGSITTVLRQGSQDYWEGPYIPHPNVAITGITHYIDRNEQQDPCLQPTWVTTNSQIPLADIDLHEPPYGNSLWAQDGNKYWLLNGREYIIINANNFERFDNCGNLVKIHHREFTKTLDNGQQQWGGYSTLPDGTRAGNWIAYWR